MSEPVRESLRVWRLRHPGLPDPRPGVDSDGGPSVVVGRRPPTPQALRHPGVPREPTKLDANRRRHRARIDEARVEAPAVPGEAAPE